jgi:CheY-like chemotaxis protein
LDLIRCTQIGKEAMRLLIAEDDQALGVFLRRGLEGDGHAVRWTGDGQAAVDAFLEDTPDLAILDLNLPRKDGTEVLRFLRSVNDDLPILILTARQEMETKINCLDWVRMIAWSSRFRSRSCAPAAARCCGGAGPVAWCCAAPEWN